jgi:hypothetical protein
MSFQLGVNFRRQRSSVAGSQIRIRMAQLAHAWREKLIFRVLVKAVVDQRSFAATPSRRICSSDAVCRAS